MFMTVLAGLAGLVACGGVPPRDEAGQTALRPSSLGAISSSDAVLARAFADRVHHLQVEGQGIVIRLLEDDEDGGRHQRFILRLASGQTLLIAHNIDIAPRLRGLQVRDSVAFFGEYEWNQEGGTIHWTHRDSVGEHVGGWLKHRGRVYQ